MKIGIITYWQSSDNYGQQLQCWALQKHLMKLGHEPYLIRYDFKNRVRIRKRIDYLKNYFLYKYVRRFISSLNDIRNISIAIKNKRRNFSFFRKENIRYSKHIYLNLKELQKNPPIADAYIVGSDQVWSQTLENKENEIFFLNFGSKVVKRIAYAPSFALNEYPETAKQRLYELLMLFDNVSVRDYTSLNICLNIGVSAVKTIDPTLLLTSKDYECIEKKVIHSIYPYVYIYILNIRSSEEIRFEELQNYMHTKSLQCKATASSGYFPANEMLLAEYIYPSIGEWINTIRHAEFVVTPSFHGIVFCIMMHTPFVYIPLKGKYSDGNNRVISLLTDLELMDRMLTDELSYKSIITKKIDWLSVDCKICELRKFSFSFINDSLK